MPRQRRWSNGSLGAAGVVGTAALALGRGATLGRCGATTLPGCAAGRGALAEGTSADDFSGTGTTLGSGSAAAIAVLRGGGELTDSWAEALTGKAALGVGCATVLLCPSLARQGRSAPTRYISAPNAAITANTASRDERPRFEELVVGRDACGAVRDSSP